MSVVRLAGDTNLALLSRLANSLLCIKDQLKHELKQGTAVAHNPDGRGGTSVADRDLVRGKLVGAQFQQAVRNDAQVNTVKLLRRAPPELAQICDEMLQAQGFVVNSLNLPPKRSRQIAMRTGNFAESENRGERIVDLMRDSGNQLAQGR